MYYKLKISETGRSSTKGVAQHFNTIIENHPTVERVIESLEKRYGKNPSRKNKIYVDGKNGVSIVIGFTYSFWNSDISHNSKKWLQTDWIEITEVVEKPVLI